MATTPPPECKAEFRCAVLQFLHEGAVRAACTLRGRTFERIELLCRQHFSGLTPAHAFERLDWRVVQELFTFNLEARERRVFIGRRFPLASHAPSCLTPDALQFLDPCRPVIRI
jgi:hypothetical protein